MFTRSAHGRRGGGAKYRRFDSAAEAIRYIIEEVPSPLWPGITVEIDDETLDHRRILELYSSGSYPLSAKRRTMNNAELRRRAGRALQAGHA